MNVLVPQTLYDKILNPQVVERLGDETCVLYVDRHMLGEVHTPQAFDGLRQSGRPVRRAAATLAVVDHNVPTSERSGGIIEPRSRAHVAALEANVAAFGVPYIPLLDERQGAARSGPEGRAGTRSAVGNGPACDMPAPRQGDGLCRPGRAAVRAKGFDEAIGLVNDHSYGNGTAIFTRDSDAARAFANNVQIGMVGINVPIPVPVACHSFGGLKASIFGDHGVYSMEGVRFYTKLKTVAARWPTGIRSGAEFAFMARN